MTSLSGFVLAGGLSRRMGRDKALLEIRGQTLLSHMVQLLSTVTASVRVVGRDDLPDRIVDCGPLGGILTALEITESPMNLIVAVDLPKMSAEFLAWFGKRLLATTHRAVVCRVDDRIPLCVGLHRDVRSELAERVQKRELAVHRFIESLNPENISKNEILGAGFPLSVFHNLNTPEDLQQPER